MKNKFEKIGDVSPDERRTIEDLERKTEEAKNMDEQREQDLEEAGVGGSYHHALDSESARARREMSDFLDGVERKIRGSEGNNEEIIRKLDSLNKTIEGGIEMIEEGGSEEQNKAFFDATEKREDLLSEYARDNNISI